MNESLLVILITLLVSMAFALWFGIFLWKRRKRHLTKYPTDWGNFRQAVDENNISEIAKFGSVVLWNESLQQDHKIIIYNEIEKRKSEHPELKKLWIDVHLLRHGIEPIDVHLLRHGIEPIDTEI